MSKITKNQRIDKLVACLRTQGRKMRELEARLSTQEKWSDYADNMLTELNHALPDPEYDAKCEAAVAGVEASLDRHRERLGLNKPQLKQLDQSAFDHPYVDDRFKYVALNADGQAVFFESKPVISNCLDIWVVHTGSVMPMLKGYDTSNWQNSLIERDTEKELTGSDLCRAMLARRDRFVFCLASNTTQDMTVKNSPELEFVLINGYCEGRGFGVAHRLDYFKYVKPVRLSDGVELTAAEAGL